MNNISHPVTISFSSVAIVYLLIGLTYNNKSVGIGLAILGIVLSVVTPYVSFELSKDKDKPDSGFGAGLSSMSSTSIMVFAMSIILLVIKISLDTPN